MHVVILAEFAVASGGAEKVALESARGLAELGLDVTYVQGVAGPADPLLDHPRIRRHELGLADVWNLPAHRAAAAGIWHAIAARRLRGVLSGLPSIDVIHLHQWTRSLSPSVFPVLAATDAPVVVTLHDYFMACPNGVYYRFDRAEPCEMRPMSAACIATPCDARSGLHKLVRLGRTAALRAALARHSLDVVHVCDASQARMGDLLGGYALTHHRLDNPVRVTKATPANPAQGDAVVYVGRLTREKGADLVADAAQAAGLPALFIGTGPLEAELRARSGVTLLGWRSPEAVAAILRARARALAAPSRWHETGPLTVYEALAAGVPVIASARSGAAEKVVDGVTGLVAAPDLAAFAGSFRQLADDARVAAMGRAAYDRYWAVPMSLEAHALGLKSLYANLATRRVHCSDNLEPPLEGAAGANPIDVPAPHT
ncbi:glycosyltransferase family 4 protein [Methylobacterium sp. A54F]